MDNVLLQLGVGGIFAVLIIREFVNLMTKMKGKSNGNGNSSDSQILKDVRLTTADTNDKVKGLYSMHSKTDNDGIPVWYMPRSFVEAQKEMARTQADTVNVIRDVVRTQEQMCETMRSIDEKIIH